jgi:outer membrane protein OmpA-like peptidoglycan-associated protein
LIIFADRDFDMKNFIALLFILAANLYCFGQDKIALNKMCFNTGSDEFGLRIIDGKFYLVSASVDTIEGGPYIDESIGKPFFDMYTVDQCKLVPSELVSEEKGIKLLMSSEFHDGPISSGKNGQILFFTCNQYFDNYAGTLGIFYSTKGPRGWSKPVSLPINSFDYNVTHPYFSDAENKLYFCSDKPGGSGGMDVYSISYRFDEWFGMKNIAAANSSLNETFPFAIENKLYFTTDRNKTTSGLDIYYLESDSLSPKGISFNSDKDDLAIFFENPTHGYFSSRRETQGLNDDVYEFTIILEEKGVEIEPVPVVQELPKELEILDDRSIINAQLEQLASRLKSLDQSLTSSNTKGLSVDFIMLMLKASKNISTEINNTYSLGKPKVNEEISRISSEITALEQLVEEEIRKLNSIASEVPVISSVENTNGANLLIDKTKVENILFATNKWEIPANHQKELSAVAALLKTNNSWKAKVSGHTDNLGGADLNMSLSKNRAAAVKKYLVSQGVSSGRIEMEYFGLTRPLASNDSEEGRLQNRRVELEILSNLESYSTIVWEELSDEAVSFKVQILSSSKKVIKGGPEFNGLPRVEEIIQNNSYKYFAGKTSSLDLAKKNQEVLEKAGFKGAFIVAFEGLTPITVKDALNKQK